MKDAFFKAGNLYSFTEGGMEAFLDQDSASGDRELAEFIGDDKFEVLSVDKGLVLELKNSEGKILTNDELDQSYLLGNIDISFFKGEFVDPDVIYDRVLSAIQLVGGTQLVNLLHQKDGLSVVRQSIHELHPQPEEE